ncbi:MAG: hypothetical protein J5I62_02965 [Flavobacteriales bacterium]|nr:hypothetical protein [Flavobacteriales bacterium]MEB2341558.1 DUF6364 family protein [Flavobacteriia bacterium]
MKAKLTLLLDKGIIEDAKEYAADHDTSLSRMFEDFLRATFSNRKRSLRHRRKVSAKVRSLRGIIVAPANLDHKEAYAEHLAKKYR